MLQKQKYFGKRLVVAPPQTTEMVELVAKERSGGTLSSQSHSISSPSSRPPPISPTTSRSTSVTLASVALLLVTLILVVFNLHALDFRGLFRRISLAMEEQRQSSPWTMALISVLLIAIWIICLVPSTPMEFIVYFIYGLGPGFLIAYAGKIIGCLGAYALGRSTCRNCCTSRLGSNELIGAIRLVVQTEPYRVCFLVRAALIPVAVKNYGLALLEVSPAPFITSLLVVEAWNTFAIAFVGSAATGQIEGNNAWQNTSTVVACISLVALGVYMAVVTRRALHKMRNDANKGVTNEEATHYTISNDGTINADLMT